jgi:hypothetical protein
MVEGLVRSDDDGALTTPTLIIIMRVPAAGGKVLELMSLKNTRGYWH